MSLPENIKAIRQKCFLRQEAFAKEIGVFFATVNRWESGKTHPSYKTMKLIAEFCAKNNIVINIAEESKNLGSGI